MFDFSIVTSWVHGLLTSLMPVGLAVFLECVIVGVCLLLMYAVIAILMIFMERKVCAAFQCRLGPVRVGPCGRRPGTGCSPSRWRNSTPWLHA